MAVPGEGEAVFEVGFGLVVLDVSRVDLCFEERHASGDACLLGLEQVDGHGSGVVGLQQLGPFLGEVVVFCLVGVALSAGDIVELVELVADGLAQGLRDALGYLDGAVVVLDRSLDVGHEHGTALAVSALGVTTRADEVGVDHVLAATGVGQHQP